jgi:hypothetical protein
MTSPEHSRPDLLRILAEVEKHLELADTIENPLERLFKREQLLEEYDSIQEAMTEESKR